MTTIDALLALIADGKPDAVAMTHVARPELEGISVFFVGPRGNAACPLFGITGALEADETTSLVDRALLKAASVA